MGGQWAHTGPYSGLALTRCTAVTGSHPLLSNSPLLWDQGDPFMARLHHGQTARPAAGAAQSAHASLLHAGAFEGLLAWSAPLQTAAAAPGIRVHGSVIEPLLISLLYTGAV